MAMLILLSPSKTIDRISVKTFPYQTLPLFAKKSLQLVSILQKFKLDELMEFLEVSIPLARLNFERYLKWSDESSANSYPAIASFKGDVYEGLKVDDFSVHDLEFAQKHLRILSGLYGILKPLDLIQPYRLEIGSRLEVEKYKNLYLFWGDSITESLRNDLSVLSIPVLVNLASQEYFKSVNTKLLKASIITPDFKEQKGKDFKTIAIHAKRARGLMARFIIKNRIDNVELLKTFDYEGYIFYPDLSNQQKWVYVR